MPVPQATLGRVAKLQDDATSTKGIKVIVGGDGTRFFLIKDQNDLWGLWQGTSAGIEVVYAPLPGLKHGDCDAVIPWDGMMVVYPLSRVVIGTTSYYPLHHIELSAPQFKAQVWRAQIDTANSQNTAQGQQIAALTQKLVEIERALGSIGETPDLAAVLAQLEALKQQSADIVSALGVAGAALGAVEG